VRAGASCSSPEEDEAEADEEDVFGGWEGALARVVISRAEGAFSDGGVAVAAPSDPVVHVATLELASNVQPTAPEPAGADQDGGPVNEDCVADASVGTCARPAVAATVVGAAPANSSTEPIGGTWYGPGGNTCQASGGRIDFRRFLSFFEEVEDSDESDDELLEESDDEGALRLCLLCFFFFWCCTNCKC